MTYRQDSNRRWRVKRTADGRWAILYGLHLWPMEPKRTALEASAYLERLKERYPGRSAEILLNQHYGQRQRHGGPYRYQMPGGQSGIVPTRTLADAKEYLRRELGRRRLPSGLIWEVLR